MRLSGQSRTARVKRTRWNQLGAAVREFRALRPATWIRLARAMVFPTSSVLIGALLVVLIISDQPGWLYLLVCVTIGLAGMLFSRSGRPTRAIEYLAARRLREHGLVRRAPTSFCRYLDAADLRAKELETRRDQLRAWLARPARGEALWGMSLDNPLFAVVSIACLLVPGLLLVSRPDRVTIPRGYSQFLIPASLLTTLAIRQLLFSRAKQRARDAAAESACPDCRYSLVNLPSTPSPIQNVVDLGPARCPECGSPWPLIPPALLKF